jgi:hypothetical protein
LLNSLLCSTQQKYYCVNKTLVKQRVEQGKLPCSAPCSTPCSANDEKLEIKIEKLKWFFHVLKQCDYLLNHELLILDVKK